MNDDSLASSNSETHAPKSVRPGDGFVKPSERIYQIIDLIARARADLAISDETASFMMKISGTTSESIFETLQHDPKTHIVALIQYLDEIAPLLVGRTTPHEVTPPTEAKP